MIKKIVLLALCVAVTSASLLSSIQHVAGFIKWTKEHKKQYATKAEFDHRFDVYTQNLARIEALNQKHANRTRFGINKFADLSKEEFAAVYLNSEKKSRKPHGLPVAYPKRGVQIPDSWDWATQGAVTPVKDQGQCGSCWSFSTTGNVEGQWFLKNKQLIGLSEQNLVDCDRECSTYENQQACDDGCNGGLMWNAFEYIIKNGGIDAESAYPYTAEDGTCAFNSTAVVAKISNWTMISTNEDDMASWLYQNGPISIAVAADEWQFYIGGVFYIPCDQDLDHGVLITGYGVETDIFFQQMPYWIIKNSWGPDWGESGYIWIERGNDECGLGSDPCSSIV